MNTISELNTFGSLRLNVDDQRSSGVIFDRVYPLGPLDRISTFSDAATPITITPEPGINIVEIKNYDLANVRYQVTIRTGGSPVLTGSTITWASIPLGLTLTNVGNQYTITGIQTAEHWESIKYFNWNLPSNRSSSPLWFLEVAIIYYDSELDRDVIIDWEIYDERYYYVSKIFSESTLSTTLLRIKSTSVAITSTSLFDLPGSRVNRASANLASSFTFTNIAEDLDLAQANITSVSSFTVKLTTQSRGAASIISTSTVTCAPTAYIAISNMTARSYISNTGNSIFATSTPFIQDPSTSVNFTIELSSANGSFGSSTSVGSATYSFTGTYSQVNSQFPLIYFWPTKNFSNNTTFVYKQYRNGVLQIQKTVSLNYASAGATQYSYTFTSGSGTWTPTYEQRVYMLMDIYTVGGGGHGWATGFDKWATPGGSAGSVVSSLNQPISQSAYSYAVGAGASISVQNATGGTTTFGSVSAAGGQHGLAAATVQGSLNVNVYAYGGGRGAGGNGSSGPATTGNNGSTVRGGAGGAGITILTFSGIAGGGGGGYKIVSTASTSSYTYTKNVGANGGVNFGSGGTGGYSDGRTFSTVADDIKVDAESGVGGVIILRLHL